MAAAALRGSGLQRRAVGDPCALGWEGTCAPLSGFPGQVHELLTGRTGASKAGASGRSARRGVPGFRRVVRSRFGVQRVVLSPWEGTAKVRLSSCLTSSRFDPGS